MILYKYVDSKGEDIIKSQRIKLASPSSFNDLFELLPGTTDLTLEQVEASLLNNDEYLQHLHSVATQEGKTNKSFSESKQELHSEPKRTNFLKKMMGISGKIKETHVESKKKIDQIALMTCFCGETSEKHNEILMWAHYAEKTKD